MQNWLAVYMRSTLMDVCFSQIYDKDEKAMKRIWQRVRKFISKPKYEFRKKRSKRSSRPANQVELDEITLED